MGVSDNADRLVARPRGAQGFRSGTVVRLVVWVLLFAGVAVGVAEAQQYFRRGFRGVPREGLPPEAARGFTFCLLMYRSVRREPGGTGWDTDYPLLGRNFMTRLPQLTTTPVTQWENGEPGYAVLEATDPQLFQCPFLFASDVGTAGFSDTEVESLREYLLRGGFLWVDDFWGDRAWTQWVSQIQRVLPEYPIVDLTPDHPLFSSVYHVQRIPQVPSIQHWRRSGGGTSERGSESSVPDMRAILDEHGRIMVVMSHDTDIADGWEREGEEDDFFYTFSPEAYAMGINILIWVMTH